MQAEFQGIDDRAAGSVRPASEDFRPRAQVEGTLTGEVGPRCQLTHRPQREGLEMEAREPPAIMSAALVLPAPYARVNHGVTATRR